MSLCTIFTLYILSHVDRDKHRQCTRTFKQNVSSLKKLNKSDLPPGKLKKKQTTNKKGDKISEAIGK